MTRNHQDPIPAQVYGAYLLRGECVDLVGVQVGHHDKRVGPRWRSGRLNRLDGLAEGLRSGPGLHFDRELPLAAVPTGSEQGVRTATVDFPHIAELNRRKRQIPCPNRHQDVHFLHFPILW